MSQPPKQSPPKAKARKRHSGVVVPHAPKWYQRLAARLIVLFARAVALTIRFRFNGFQWMKQTGGKPAIFCFWHNRLALATFVGEAIHGQSPGQNGFAALVSASKDGAFLVAIIEAFKIHAVRGSSSRRGAQALLELSSWAERGYHLAITPDGPRGPQYQVQEGVILLAQVTGLPILPYSYRLSHKLTIKSWDRFQIPLPFSRCDVVFGDLMSVSRDANDLEREKARDELENRLLQITTD